MSVPRILIVSHGHPDFSLGGAEIAAQAHWAELRRRGIEAMLVSRVSHSPGHAGAIFFARSPDGFDVLFCPPPVNHFRHSQPQGRVVYEEFRALLDRFGPTVVHFQHYAFVGLEFIREARKYSSSVPIIVTLHEFLAICNAKGQMLKTNGLLCQRAAPFDCHMCFPDISSQDFFMRELFIKSFFDLVDLFVCPSEFLRDRYVAWGLPRQKMVVLENGQPRRHPDVVEGTSDPDGLETRFVVLGQLSHLKGTLVLLDAVRLLPKRLRKTIRIEIHGTTQYAADEFKLQFEKALNELQDTVSFCGPYRSGDVGGIVRNSGWVIVPSTWWENSPLVIQEAFAAGRPVICSNVGGMAEKVTHGVNGIHFRVNSAGDLAARIEECAGNPALWKKLRSGLPAPPTIDQTVDQLLALYHRRSALATSAEQARQDQQNPSLLIQPIVATQ
ncbi:MAG TPA: glycosyltransferase family 4 protein [Candidatus Sulfotelmatobacter sp.]|nr:glycosyltransferase family 4 protein [Candidatus Sulfotelmatobacter sp.]